MKARKDLIKELVGKMIAGPRGTPEGAFIRNLNKVIKKINRKAKKK
jgi:hypothetical protein